MAFLREYDYRESEDVLVEYFFYSEGSETPSLVIRMDVSFRSMRIIVHRPYISDSIIVDEVRRLLDLINKPHWKSYVNIVTSHHRFKQLSLL